MINFAVKPAPQVTPEDKVRKLVMGVTTAILVVYLVVITGFLGWRWYWSDKEEADQSQLQELAEQVEEKSTTEVLIRKLAARSQKTRDYLNSRPNVYLTAEKLEKDNVKIQAWKLETANKHTAEAVASSTAILNSYVQELAGKYQAVQIDQSKWMANKNWVNTITLGGIIK